MEKYIITSENVDGNITVGYSDTGRLIYYSFSWTPYKEEVVDWILKRLYQIDHKDSLLGWAKKNSFRVDAVSVDLSFERFWREYGVKRKKEPAKEIWELMDDNTRAEVFTKHEGYKRYCARNTWYNKQLPVTYLKGGYKDDWDKM